MPKPSKRKVALLSGITGQDGSYLAEFLLDKGYEVHGIIRRSSSFNTGRIDHIYQDPHERGKRLFLHYGDLTDSSVINQLVKTIKPDEIYHLGAQSHVKVSFEMPEYTADVTGVGTVRLLDAIRDAGFPIKFYNAASSEMFGLTPPPQSETTPFHPRSPYAVAKVYSHYITQNYREAYGMFAVSGILFNHESSRRGETFVTRKITRGIAKIIAGKMDKLYLGNLDAKRDWGYAPEYCIDLETSLLTNKGFKFHDDISEGDVVLNYNPQKDRLERDKVLKKIYIQTNGAVYFFQGRGLKLRCTANHRIYYQRKSINSKGGWSEWKVAETKDFYEMIKNLSIRTKYDFRLPHTQGYQKKDIAVKDQWFNLIGYLITEGAKKDNNRTLEISLSQSKRANRKVYNDIKKCIRSLGLEYRERVMSDGTSEFIFNSQDSKKIIDYFDGFDIHALPKWIFNAGNKQLSLVLKSMMDGDGSWGSMTYVSKRQDVVHSFQTLATILGYRTTLHQRKSGMFECVLISQRKKYAYVTKCSKEKSHEKFWCITTKNGTIVTNKDGGIAVSGNCEAMWKMMQLKKPDDFVIGTGQSHSVREFLEEAFELVGLPWKQYVEIDPRYFRPSEVPNLVADTAKARRVLGWKPKVTFKELAKIMLEADLADVLGPQWKATVEDFKRAR